MKSNDEQRPREDFPPGSREAQAAGCTCRAAGMFGPAAIDPRCPLHGARRPGPDFPSPDDFPPPD